MKYGYLETTIGVSELELTLRELPFSEILLYAVSSNNLIDRGKNFECK